LLCYKCALYICYLKPLDFVLLLILIFDSLKMSCFISLKIGYLVSWCFAAPPWSSGSVLDHISLPPVFESRRGHIRRLFRLSLRLITFGGRSAHLAYIVHKIGRKTSIIIIIIMFRCKTAIYGQATLCNLQLFMLCLLFSGICLFHFMALSDL